MDLYCQYCGEPGEHYHIHNDATPEERQVFLSGLGCPACYQDGKRIKTVAKQPFRAELSAAMSDIFGDDTDGLASAMEDSEFIMGEEFWD